uniref:Uncharacterized protein n=1 Tax=Arundo donax TaxID=35708 RepID=A0A0A9C6Q0_ARUDO
MSETELLGLSPKLNHIFCYKFPLVTTHCALLWNHCGILSI